MGKPDVQPKDQVMMENLPEDVPFQQKL